MCQCYTIGGPFIAEDPDCPTHGTEAQATEARQRKSTEGILARLEELEARVETLEAERARTVDRKRTPAQKTQLLWFLEKEQEVPSRLRVKTKHDPRVIKALHDAKLLEITHHHGPHYGLTEPGRVEAIAIQIGEES